MHSCMHGEVFIRRVPAKLMIGRAGMNGTGLGATNVAANTADRISLVRVIERCHTLYVATAWKLTSTSLATVISTLDHSPLYTRLNCSVRKEIRGEEDHIYAVS